MSRTLIRGLNLLRKAFVKFSLSWKNRETFEKWKQPDSLSTGHNSQDEDKTTNSEFHPLFDRTRLKNIDSFVVILVGRKIASRKTAEVIKN